MKLTLSHKHGFTVLVPAEAGDRAHAVGLAKHDPAAQRPFDNVNGVEIPRVPDPANLIRMKEAYQEVAVWRSADGRTELAKQVAPGEQVPQEVDIPD